MKEDRGKSRRERQRVHLGEKNREWDRVWEEMRSDIKWERVVEPFGEKKKSYTLNVEKASSLRRKGVANLLPQKKEGWQFTVFHYVIRKTPGQSKQ